MTSTGDLLRPVEPACVRRCAPGDWYAVLAARATVLLPPGARDRVAGAWDLADRGAGFDELLDLVVSDGLQGLTGLALVGDLEGGRVRVLLRGPVRARIEGAQGTRLLRSEAESWSDRSLSDVRSIALAVDGSPAAPELAVDTGIARVASVVLGSAGPRRLVPVPSPRALETPERPTLGLRTATAVPAETVATLVFSTGAVVPVDRSIVVGRTPRGSSCGVSSAEEARLVAVPSPLLEISASHLEVRPDAAGRTPGTALVTDLSSTNGTLLLRPGRPPSELVPGLPMPLLPGDVLDLGEGVTIRAQRA